MVIVREAWKLRPEYASDAAKIMQEMDDLVGPGAHAHSGWSGHAEFHQNINRPTDVTITYQWASAESHRTLVQAEIPVIAEFTTKYCSEQRQIEYYEILAVDVDD
jgi:hypothetical protein